AKIWRARPRTASARWHRPICGPRGETPLPARYRRNSSPDLSLFRPSLFPSSGRYLVERHILVDPDIAGQPEHALGDDVAHDLVGAAFDAGTWRAQQHRLEFSGRSA